MTHSQATFTRSSRGLGLIVAFAALWAAWRTIQPGGDFAFLMFQDWATALAATIATLLLAFGARKGAGPTRAGWLLMAIGTGMWAVGEIGWSLYDLRGVAPFPSILDVAYLAGYVPLTIGVVLIASPDRSLARTRTVLDGLALVLSATAFMWLLVLEPTYADSESTFAAKAIGGAYPILDLVVLFAVLVAVVRFAHGSGAMVIRSLCVGVGLTVLADTGFAYVSLHEWHTVGEWLSAGWVFGYLFIALAALLQMDHPIQRAAQGDRATVSAAWRQAGPLTMLLGFLAFWMFGSGSMTGDLPFMVMIALAALLITARQFVVLQDNVQLNGALSDAGRALEKRVQERTQELSRLVSILEATPDVVVTADIEGTPFYVNRAGRKLLHPPTDGNATEQADINFLNSMPAWVVELMQTEALPEALRKGTWTGEAALLAADGSERPTSHAVIVHRDPEGRIEFVSNIARDISAQKQLERDLRHQAFHDALTGLANRARFIERLEHALVRARRTGDGVAVLFVDIDQFKSVNDGYGHSLGDALLVRVGERLLTLLREGDTIARLGGDEFAVLLDGSTDVASAEATARRLVDCLQMPFTVDGREVFAHASVGVALATDREEGSELLRRADLAMYTAKANGKNRFEIYDEHVQSAMRTRLQLLSELDGAVERGEFVLHFQPEVSIRTGKLLGVEALVRWQHPRHGLVQPNTFIPLAEESGAILALGRWVLATASRQFMRWQATHPGTMQWVAVNVSARQLHDGGFVQDVEAILKKSGLEAGCLVIEITESATMQDPKVTIDVLNQLKQLGVRLAIDDFGTGYSSLNHLRQFPFDVLKIDKSFVDGISTDDTGLASAIVNIAKSLSLETVGEGVEQERQLDSLRALECDVAQGYFFSRPVAADEIDAILDDPELLVGANVFAEEQSDGDQHAA